MPRAAAPAPLLIVACGLLGAWCGAAGAEDETRDQELLGVYYANPLSRLSFYGGVGFGSVRGGSSRLDPSGGLSFDLGILWDLHEPVRLGLSFNHFQFTEHEGGLDLPREVSDLTGFVRFDGRDRNLTPYVKLGGGFYFSDNAENGNLLRGALGIDIPVSRVMLRVEGRYSSYSQGAFRESGGRQSTLSLVLGARLPLALGDKTSAGAGGNPAERLRTTLRYVASEDEREELARTADEELPAFFEAFWDRRDPYPGSPENPERDSFLYRVNLATDRFGEIGLPGWKSERGRVMIVHGLPDEVIWEQDIPHTTARNPLKTGLEANTASSTALELWIYYQALPRTDGRQSFVLFEEDAVSRYLPIWTNVRGEPGYGRALPPLPPTIAAPISGVSSSF